MPSGRVHTATTLMLAAVVLVIHPQAVPGVLSGIIISPDLDCDDGYIGLWHLRRIPFVGPVISWVWRMFWYIYSKKVAHRSYISHSIFFGTCFRVAWLFMPILFLNYYGWMMKFDNFGDWFIGLCLSDILHIILDSTMKGREREE